MSLWRRDVSIVDGMWPVFIASAGMVYACTAAPPSAARLAALALLTVWAVRLCIHITVRNHGQPEDRRYQKIRANNQPNFELKSLYIVFGLQAVARVDRRAAVHGHRRAPPELGAGSPSWACCSPPSASLFEAVADWQLERFKKRPDEQGRACSTAACGAIRATPTTSASVACGGALA